MKVMVVDINRCNGCFNCQIACKDEHVDNDWSPYAKPQPDTGHFWMNVEMKERGQFPKVKVAYIPKPCMHCQNPNCIQDAFKGAVRKRQDGIVIIDPEKSRGQKEIVHSCPYKAIYWNEELNIPQKCHFCSHLIDEDIIKEPRCVEACPTEALIFGEYEDLKVLLEEKAAEILYPELGTRPSVYYIGLPKRFIAGTVIFEEKDECAENVEVTITGPHINKMTKTNNYGDFEFEGLEADQTFSIKVEYPGFNSKEYKVRTENDVYLGEIFLTKQL